MELQFTKSKTTLVPTVEINRKIENKQNLTFFLSGLFVFAELLLITFIFFLLYEWRNAQEFNRPMNLLFWSGIRFNQYLFFYASFMIIFIVCIYRFKLIKFHSSFGFSDELLRIFKSYSFAVLIAIGISFLLKFADFSRLVIISFWIVSFFTTSSLRGLKRILFIQLASKGVISKNVLIVGAGKIGKSLINELTLKKWLGYNVIGYVDDALNVEIDGINCLGKTNQLKSVLYHHHIDEIIITIPSERDLVYKLITNLRKLNIKITIVPDMFNLMMSTVQIGNINALPIVSLVKTPMHGLGLIIKRIFDVFISLLLAGILLPLFFIVSIAIKLDSPGPIFYKQTRLGKNAKPFKMLKFRSMVIGADKLVQQLSNQNTIQGPAFKVKNDPRRTKVGTFIRKYSIDELPQIFNVIAGHMSLVGPRPPLPSEVEQYGDWEWRRLEIVPGITGLWQVSGRSDLSFQQWMNLDIYYIENWSLVLDLKILLKTIPVVFKGEGAY